MKNSPYSVVQEYGDLWPRVTVVVPLYNYAGMVHETLDSVAKQEIHDLGLVIVDDASTDESLKVAGEWVKANKNRFSKLCLLTNTQNSGLSVTRNNGIDHVKSEYIFFLDADNLMYPTCLSRLLEALSRTDAGSAYSMLRVFGSKNSVIGSRVFDTSHLKFGNYVDAQALFRRTALLECGGYRPMQYGWEDYDLWLTFVEHGYRVIQVPEILGSYRAHESSMTSTNTSRNLALLRTDIMQQHPWLEMPDLPPIFNGNAVEWYDRYWRYSRLAARLFSDQSHLVGGKLRFAGRMLRAWRAGGTTGLANELRAIESLVTPQAPRMQEHAVFAPKLGAFVDSSDPVGSLPFDLKGTGETRIAAVLHIFYPELANEMFAFLKNIARPVDVFITTTTIEDAKTVEEVFASWHLGKVKVSVACNRGRDIAPKLLAFPEVYDNYDLLLHLHTKRSLHEGELGTWREYLFQHLVGSPKIVDGIISAFECDPALGMVAPQHFLPIRGWLHAGANMEHMREIISRAKLSYDPHSLQDFPSGSMMWTRPQALAPLLNAGLTFDDFPEETGQTDGTLAHAIERLYFIVCETAGFNWIKVARPDIGGQHGRLMNVSSFGDLSELVYAKSNYSAVEHEI